jgi:hypothetical protein
MLYIYCLYMLYILSVHAVYILSVYAVYTVCTVNIVFLSSVMQDNDAVGNVAPYATLAVKCFASCIVICKQAATLMSTWPGDCDLSITSAYLKLPHPTN